MRSSLRTVLLVALAAGLARALTVAGLELYSDEAYYWLWSLRPAFGYFDHPPMVAWLIATTSRLVPGELGVRLPFFICGALAVVFAGLTARELSPHPRAPLYGALLAAASPMLHLTGALALPDAPLTAAYAAGTWLLARARGTRWAWAGVAVGLALVSKYSAALLAPALMLLVLWDPELRADLRTRWPWVGAAVAVAIFLPTLLWDARQGFPSIGFQLHHGFRGDATLRTFGEFLGAQVASAGPIPLAIGVAVLSRARGSAWRRVAAATLLPVAVPLYSAITGVPEVNWAVHAFPSLAAATGAWLAGRRAGPALVGASLALLAVVVTGFVFVQWSPRFAGVSAHQRFHGWKDLTRDLAAEVDALCRGGEHRCDPADPFVLPSSYRLAPVAFYSGWTRLGGDVGRPTQLDLWNDQPRPGEPILALSPGEWNANYVRERHRLVPLGPRRHVVVRTPGGDVLREAFLEPLRPP